MPPLSDLSPSFDPVSSQRQLLTQNGTKSSMFPPERALIYAPIVCSSRQAADIGKNCAVMVNISLVPATILQQGRASVTSWPDTARTRPGLHGGTPGHGRQPSKGGGWLRFRGRGNAICQPVTSIRSSNCPYRTDPLMPAKSTCCWFREPGHTILAIDRFSALAILTMDGNALKCCDLCHRSRSFQHR